MFDPYTETVLTNIGINIIMTLSMYFPLAVGQLSIAQVGFMAIGAHLATVLTLYWQVPFVFAVLAAALVPWGIGLLFGCLILRLQGLTLAFATFAFMEIVQIFFLNFPPTGDARGLKGIAPLTQLWHVWSIALGLMWFFYRLRRSRMGRAMAMVKHDEVVASALGVNVYRVKAMAFAAGALVAGVGGAFCIFSTVTLAPIKPWLSSPMPYLVVSMSGLGGYWVPCFYPICLCSCRFLTTGAWKSMAPSSCWS
jgi:branched-chain amino acid transport system permease protein